MKAVRRFLLILLDPRPPLWASSGWWTSIGVVLIFSALFAPAGAWRWTPFFTGMALVIVSGVIRFLRQSQMEWYRKQLIQRGAGLCPRCGYKLDGITDLRCPECGTDIEAAAKEAVRAVKPEA